MLCMLLYVSIAFFPAFHLDFSAITSPVSCSIPCMSYSLVSVCSPAACSLLLPVILYVSTYVMALQVCLILCNAHMLKGRKKTGGWRGTGHGRRMGRVGAVGGEGATGRRKEGRTNGSLPCPRSFRLKPCVVTTSLTVCLLHIAASPVCIKWEMEGVMKEK